MRKISFTDPITDQDILHIDLLLHAGKILKFTVQYHAKINNGWRTVLRYDTSHGYAHMDKYHLHMKRVKVTLNTDDLNKAFNKAKNHIKRDFLKIKQNFLDSK